MTLPEDVTSQLLPSLSTELVHRVLGRTSYTAQQEREAELLASLIGQAARAATRPVAAPADLAEGLARLDVAFSSWQRRS